MHRIVMNLDGLANEMDLSIARHLPMLLWEHSNMSEAASIGRKRTRGVLGFPTLEPEALFWQKGERASRRPPPC